MKVTITETEILVEVSPGCEVAPKVDWSCRLASHEVCAWAVKRLGEELQKSVKFYQTGVPTDNIIIDEK